MQRLPSSTVILGIDPGSQTTGYGVIQSNGKQLTYLTSGCISVRGKEMSERLQDIYRGLCQIIQQYLPSEIAIEQIFMHHNPSAALKLGQARGAAMVAADGIKLAEYTARQIKQAVVGYGNAEKTQVQHMVKVLLGIQKTVPADAADALAVAVCHAHTRQSLGRLQIVKSIRRGRLR